MGTKKELYKFLEREQISQKQNRIKNLNGIAYPNIDIEWEKMISN